MFSKLTISIARSSLKKRLGRTIRPFENMATHPDVAAAWVKFNQALYKTNLVDAKLKTLGQIRAAKLVECPF